MECVYAANKTKAKPLTRVSAKGGNNANRLVEPGKAEIGSGKDRGTKRMELSDGSDTPYGAHGNMPSGQKKRTKTSDSRPNGSPHSLGSETTRGLRSPNGSTPSSSSMPGSDLAMIQNNDSPIPMDPTFGGQDEWWNDLLGMLGKSRKTAIRMVQGLLTRFIQSNAVFFGLLHAPTLLGVVSGTNRHTRADPALYLAVLAVSACDMHQTRIADERTSDMRSANEASRKLASRLSEMAASYLQTSTAHGSALTPAIGQAASILALTQPDGSTEQSSLIRLAENVVRTLKLHETVSSREPLLQDSEPDSPLYWSRPMTSDSPESEVKYESIVRLCWTGIAHRFRKYIAKPDDDFGDIDLPEYIQEIRPMAFWQPSLLPADLPPAFFHSQDLMRRSAHLSRLTVELAQLEKAKEVGEGDSVSADTLEKVQHALQSLDQLEKAFVRHRPRSEAEKQNVLGRTLQMFCRMHVWVRLTIWRKYRLWNSPKGTQATTGGQAQVSSDGTVPAPPTEQQQSLFQQQQHHPTVDFWLTVVKEMADTMQQDLDAHAVDQTALRTSISDVDALARHVICACDLIEASGITQPILAQVEGALSILKRVLAYAELHGESDGLQISQDVAEKVRAAEDKRAGLKLGQDEPDTDATMAPVTQTAPISV